MSGNKAVIGVDVGGTGTKAGIVDPAGTMVARVERPTDNSAGTKGIITVVEDLFRRASDLGYEVVAVGIGAAGFVDFARGSVTFSPNLQYDDPEIAAALRARVNVPVVVDNDANAAAWGERRFGVARDMEDMVLLTLGTGVGSGIIAGGRLVRGATGAGAEFGHIVIDPNGPLCGCGLRGCFEQFASGQAIERMARDALKEDPQSSIAAFADDPDRPTAKDVARAAREYDETARAVLRAAGRYLGIGLSNAANLFDPEAIVLSGSVVLAGEPYLGPARDVLVEMTGLQRRRPMRIDVSALGEDAGVIGAAALALEEVGE
ncbi:MAG TPA: ROK family glucokinase [Actinomycetota bacterium]|nr:ROK family glucokinase [Actinomycetota bacterium]